VTIGCVMEGDVGAMTRCQFGWSAWIVAMSLLPSRRFVQTLVDMNSEACRHLRDEKAQEWKRL